MTFDENRWRSVALLASWGAIELGGRLHLVGVLLGGHDRLPAGHWIITSPARFLNPQAGTAVTASRGRLYVMERPFTEPWPDEALELIARAMRLWGVPGEPPRAPIAWDRLPEAVSRLGLGDAIDPAAGPGGKAAPGAEGAR